MKLKTTALTVFLALFALRAVAQPVPPEQRPDQMQQPEMRQAQPDRPENTAMPDRPGNRTEARNISINRSEMRNQAPGRTAQFDARLMTAINTLDSLEEIAPT